MPQFFPDERAVATVPIRVSPKGVGVTVQLYLEPGRLSSVGARIISTGNFEDVSFNMHLPSNPGLYSVLLDIEIDGQDTEVFPLDTVDIVTPTEISFSVVLVNPRPGLESWNATIRVGPFGLLGWLSIPAVDGNFKRDPDEAIRFSVKSGGTMDLPYYGAFDVNQYLWHPFPVLTLEIGGKYYPDRVWVEGYWVENMFGRFWVEGHWSGTGYWFQVSPDVSVSQDMVYSYNDGG